MTPSRFEQRRLSFGPAASLYDEIRPSYPPEAARWILGDAPLRVVDLGAGTGKFSRVLAALGHEVIAIEPDPGMRAVLEEASPGVTALAGSAESMPLRSESVDAVVAAQSFHWFANDLAREEIARVVRPGGVFGPIWNVRDDSVPWVAELTRTVLQGDGSSSLARLPERDFGPAFATAGAGGVPLQRRAHDGHARRPRQEQVEVPHGRRADARSMVAAAEAVTAGLPQPFELPYTTIAFRAVRL